MRKENNYVYLKNIDERETLNQTTLKKECKNEND